jgi:hypothetical protein
MSNTCATGTEHLERRRCLDAIAVVGLVTVRLESELGRGSGANSIE